MLRGSKSSYSAKQKRQTLHIEEGCKKKGTPSKEAKKRAWATVNKTTGGAKKSKSAASSGKSSQAKKGGKLKTTATQKRSTASRSAAARKAAATRKQSNKPCARKTKKQACIQISILFGYQSVLV